MAATLCNEMVEVPGEIGAYYKANIRQRKSDGKHICTIPEVGKCIVEKEMPRYSCQGIPFAWKIVFVYPKEVKQCQTTENI